MTVDQDIDFDPSDSAALAKFYGRNVAPDLHYYDPIEVLGSDLTEVLSPDSFRLAMVRLGELEEITNDYAHDCFMLCHNSVAWAVKQILSHQLGGDNFKIIVGSFMRVGLGIRGEHSWLLYQKDGKKFYVDLTLAQFLKKAPQLTVTDAIDSDNSFNVWEELTVEEYLNSLL